MKGPILFKAHLFHAFGDPDRIYHAVIVFRFSRGIGLGNDFLPGTHPDAAAYYHRKLRSRNGCVQKSIGEEHLIAIFVADNQVRHRINKPIIGKACSCMYLPNKHKAVAVSSFFLIEVDTVISKKTITITAIIFRDDRFKAADDDIISYFITHTAPSLFLPE